MTSPVPTYTIDDVTLRDVPDDVVAARARVAGLRAQGAAGDAERIGWLRMLGDLDEAERVGWRSLAAAGGPGTAGDVPVAGADVDLPIEAVGAALRLAHVLQWQRRFELADALFRAGRERADATARSAAAGTRDYRVAVAMRYFARQHGGKSLFDQGRYDEALGMFAHALALRLAAGAPQDQIDSSRQAVRAAGWRLIAARRAT